MTFEMFDGSFGNEPYYKINGKTVTEKEFNSAYDKYNGKYIALGQDYTCKKTDDRKTISQALNEFAKK